jgi:hypothetical protein
MKKILRTTIVCLLIPSLLFAQIPQYRGNESSVKQTDLARVWNALNTDVGQQIVSYIETTVGSIDLEHAKAFITAKGEVAFVPIKSFSKVLAALCYRQLEDGSEYLFLITYNAAEKGVSFTFLSGQMYVIKSSGVTESANPDFQFQEYDDLSNRVGINDDAIFIFIGLLCSPLAALFNRLPAKCCYGIPRYGGTVCNPICIFLKILFLITPLLFIYSAYSYPDLNLEVISIIFAVYYYVCVLAVGDPIWPI